MTTYQRDEQRIAYGVSQTVADVNSPVVHADRRRPQFFAEYVGQDGRGERVATRFPAEKKILKFCQNFVNISFHSVHDSDLLKAL